MIHAWPLVGLSQISADLLALSLSCPLFSLFILYPFLSFSNSVLMETAQLSYGVPGLYFAKYISVTHWVPPSSVFPRIWQGFPGSSDGKESACNAGDPGSIPG